MGRSITFTSGEYYHVYNRGVDKREIFKSKEDYARFLAILYLANNIEPMHMLIQGRTLKEVEKRGTRREQPLIDVCVYSLMPNHFHLLLRESSDGGISKFMQKFGNSYTGYFNQKYERTGVLFQGKYRVKHVTNEQYLSHLISYIHLNSLEIFQNDWKEAGVKNQQQAQKYLAEYSYSSYPDYLDIERLENKIINKNALPEYFKNPEDFNYLLREISRSDLELGYFS